ncbi:MAG TPA: tRNA pseudouridine(38-40) synthase TruA [Flavobacterium sp.]
MRYFIEFSYNGTNYHGWQIQPNATSVQEKLNDGLSVLLSEKIETTGAGRTDSGVHARQMFAHFDYEGFFEVPQLVHKLNSYLPKDIAVADIIPVHDDAHARFDAKKRTYEYRIHTSKDVFLQDLSWHYHNELDVEMMNLAANALLRHEDFQCFSKVNTDVNTFNCTVAEAHWEQHENKLIFKISADRFLRNMVRAIVGTLINVGLQKIHLDEFMEIIESRDRSKAGFSVPAHGLYLTHIEYEYIK